MLRSEGMYGFSGGSVMLELIGAFDQVSISNALNFRCEKVVP